MCYTYQYWNKEVPIGKAESRYSIALGDELQPSDYPEVFWRLQELIVKQQEELHLLRKELEELRIKTNNDIRKVRYDMNPNPDMENHGPR